MAEWLNNFISDFEMTAHPLSKKYNRIKKKSVKLVNG